MAKLLSVTHMLAIEKAANAVGHSYAEMIQNAGQSIANLVIAHSHNDKQKILALVGTGNNGADALAALEKLSQAGYHTHAILAQEREKDPLIDALQAAGGRVSVYAQQSKADIQAEIDASDIFLDALLGTGIALPLRAPASEILARFSLGLEQSEDAPLVIAVDCPSGMHVQTGEIAPETIPADITLCMAAVKSGMLTFPAFEYLGELFVGEIGLPEDFPEWNAIKHFIVDQQMAFDAIPARPLNAHKGSFGKALIVAGSSQFPGAALLAASAAARSGVGLVSIAQQRTLKEQIAGHLPEATWLDGPHQSLLLEDYQVLLIGPGLNDQSWQELEITQLLKRDNLPNMVLDAEALRFLSGEPDGPKSIKPISILTPHPGEFAALTGLSSAEVQAQRLALAEKYAREWGHILVLKGALTVIAAPDGRLAVVPIANPALATAGSGDVLAGLIAGLWAQGLVAFEAAYLAAWVHAQAANAASERYASNRGILASDLTQFFPAILAK